MELQKCAQFLWIAWFFNNHVARMTSSAQDDCGIPANSFNTWFDLADEANTSVGAVADVYCYTGTTLHFIETISCDADGTWPTTSCDAPDCGIPSTILNGQLHMFQFGKTTYGAVAEINCNPGFRRNVANISCQLNGEWEKASCTLHETSSIVCPASTDDRGMTWDELPTGIAKQEHCPHGFIGVVTRKCSLDGTWERPQYNCIRDAVIEIVDKMENLNFNFTPEGVAMALQDIDNITSHGVQTDMTSLLTGAEITALTGSMEFVANMLADNSIASEEIVLSFVQTVSNLVDDGIRETWQALKETQSANGEKILNAVDRLGSAIRSGYAKGNNIATNISIFTVNVAFEMRKIGKGDIAFSSTTILRDGEKSQSRIELSANALRGNGTIYTAVIYEDLRDVLSEHASVNRSSNVGQVINGPVLSLTISDKLRHLDTPVQLTFKHTKTNLSNPICSYWKYGSSNESGYWATDGCVLQATNEYTTVCECYHLTNFAVLMSPFVEADEQSVPLRLVSSIGIGLSMMCLLLTILIYTCLWRNLKKDRSVLLLNLCLALLIAYVVFLAGIDRTTNKVLCTVIAALLHYIYLVVFFLMLAEGVDLIIMTVYVFAAKSRLQLLLLSAWILPGVIVGISLASTQTSGYGNDRFCWLSLTRGVIWGFVAPALFVIVVNLVCLIVVIKKMFGMKAMTNKSSTEKIKTSLRSLCVLVPLMGVSWILGIFYVNESASFMQYVFAICNSMQGLFIFVFNCVFHKPVRNACKPFLNRCPCLSAMVESKKKPSSTQATSSTLSSSLERSIDVVSDVASNDEIKHPVEFPAEKSMSETAKDCADDSEDSNVSVTTADKFIKRAFGDVVHRKECIGEL